MAFIGFHASQEQFSPSELLTLAQLAEQEGFAAVMSADHFNPWSERQGQSGFTWAWLGAAMQATQLPFGSLAIPGGWRYHPAILAQAIATLCELFPHRLAWIAAGSGQALNERIAGGDWPSKAERNRRLKAGVDMMRALWAGETVTCETGPIRAHEAKLWTLPQALPKVFAATLTPDTARWAGEWADGLITVNQPRERLEAVIDAFRSHPQNASKPLYLQVHVSWAESEEKAQANAYDQWRTNSCSTALSQMLDSPALYDEAAAHVRPEDMTDHVLISANLTQQRAWLETFIRMGFSGIFVHNVGRNQRAFITAFGQHVLPGLATGH